VTKRIAAALAFLALWALPALAQTSPNWTYGYVPTVGQWNAIFAAKQDYLGAAPLLVTGGTMTGPLVTAAPTALTTGLNLAPGVNPSAPNNGDLWVTSGGLFVQINGSTVGPLASASSPVLAPPVAITGANAAAFAVGLTGAVGSALIVDTSVALQASGLRITGAVTGGTVNLSANDTGPNTNITLNANGSGTIGIGNVSTGAVTITPATTITGAATLSSTLTYGGVTLSNSVTGTGSMVLSAAPTISGAATLTGVPVLSGLSAGTCSNGIAINASNQAIKVACPAAAASVQIGVTTVTSGTTNNILYNNGGTLGNETIASILTAGTGITISGTTNATIGLSTITGPGGVLGTTGNGAGQTVTTVKTEVFLETLNPAGVATSPTTVTWAGFNHIKFHFSNCIPATTSQQFLLQVVTGGGTQTTNYAGQIVYSASASPGGISSLTTAFTLSGAVLNTAAQGTGGTVVLHNIQSTTLGHQLSGTFVQNTTVGGAIGQIWTGTAALTGGVFLFNSGNITSCRIDVWGIP
jgi:hypothetical protein